MADRRPQPTPCGDHPKYSAKAKPKTCCEGCWMFWFENAQFRAQAILDAEAKAQALKEREERREWIAKWKAANPGWTWGSGGPRQLGAYDVVAQTMKGVSELLAIQEAASWYTTSPSTFALADIGDTSATDDMPRVR